MNGRTWLVARVLLALVLMVAFYVLALGLSFGMLWLAYADVTDGRRVHVKVVAFCVLGAGAILWSLIPRPDKFEAPGPRVMPAHEPELFKALREIAARTQQEMPAEVYLVNDVNAFVAQRGGVMGFGSRRVMGLGLPLMQALTVQEFKAVLAHEFGHYHAGDVRLGPWIYKTRGAVGRTIQHLDGNILQKLFVWYGEMFLRITHAISRRQEFIADEVAARAAGAGAMMSGLRKVHAAAIAFQGYWQTEVAPVLGTGYLPPISNGFLRFMGQPRMVANLAEAVAREEREGKTDPYDTHPSLGDRIAALAAQPAGQPGDNRRAASLLSDLPRWERRLLGTIVDDDWARSLKPIEWEKVADAVYQPVWQDRVAKHAAELQDVRADAIPPSQELAKRGARLTEPGEELSADQRAHRMAHLIAAGLCVKLTEQGWTVQTAPGEEIVLRREEHELRPFSEVPAVVLGQTPAAHWQQRCAAMGIAGLAVA